MENLTNHAHKKALCIKHITEGGVDGGDGGRKLGVEGLGGKGLKACMFIYEYNGKAMGALLR